MKDCQVITDAALEAGITKMLHLFTMCLGTYKYVGHRVMCMSYGTEFTLEYVSDELSKVLDVVWNATENKLKLVFADDNDDMTNEFFIFPESIEDAKQFITNHMKSWG